MVSGNDAVWEGTGQGTWKTTGKPVEFPMIMSLVYNDAGEILLRRSTLTRAEFEPRRSSELNRVQFETRSTNLPKPPRGRRSELESTGFKLDAV